MSDYSDAVLALSPYLYWRLNDQAGTVAEDASPNNRDGTYNGSPTLAQPGLIPSDPTDDAVLFDATNDYVRSNVILNTGDITLICWFDYSGTPPGASSMICGLVNSDGSGQTDKVLFMDTSGRVIFYLFDGVARETSPSSALSAGPHMLVGVADDAAAFGTSRCYVDGVEAGTHTPTAPSHQGYTDNNIFVAGSSSIYGRLAGIRDEFAVFTDEIGPGDIADLYDIATTVAGQTPPFANVTIR